MSTLVVIPSRYASTRLPGKSLIKLCGKPLVQWVYERARQAKGVEDVLVATDDSRIRSAVEAFGGKAVMTREDHPSGTDRIAEAMGNSKAEIVINVQGDEPLIDPRLIEQLGGALRRNAMWDMATAATPIRDASDIQNPSVVKVVWDHNHRAMYFSRSTIPFIRDAGFDSRRLYWRHIGIYAYRAAFLRKLVATPPCALEEAEKLEQLRALYLGASMYVAETSEYGLGVDTPDDVPKAEAALRAAGLA